mmetsp:Transcript_129535/g.375188  ORF Transcript_129535/g.375188 Transcript_129535/m.375188 type:complete len:375 (+) Transcript_129535:278-1402(+)
MQVGNSLGFEGLAREVAESRVGYHGRRVLPFRRPGDDVERGAQDGIVIISDAASGRQLRRFRHDGMLNCAHILPRSSLIVACGGDDTLLVWGHAAATLPRVIPAPTRMESHGAVQDSFRCAEPFPDGRRVLTWGRHMWATVWDVVVGEALAEFGEHLYPVSVGRAFPRDDLVATGGLDGFAIVWHAGSGERHATIGHTDTVVGLELLREGELLVTLTASGATSVWEMGSGRQLHALTRAISTIADLIFGIKAFPGGDRLLTFTSEAAVIRDVTSGETLHRLSLETSYLGDAAVAPDGEFVVTCGNEVVTIWNASSGEVVRSTGKATEAETQPPAVLHYCFLAIGLTSALDAQGFGNGLSWRELPGPLQSRRGTA